MQMKNSSPSLSFVVPVHNDALNLRECLSALLRSAPAQSEIIVVDDASADNSSTVAAELGARCYRLPKNSGPAVARNYGALRARGNILFFVDADVVISPRAVARVIETFRSNAKVDAVFGSYDRHPRAPGLISQFRNLLHHFFHQNGKREASTFWAGCGAIRRTVFLELNGFDESSFEFPSIEDVELGCRLKRAGGRILLAKTVQVTHLKRWTFRSMIGTDIKRRAIPWSRLILETGQFPNELNLQNGQRACAALVGLAGLLLVAAFFRTELAYFAVLSLGAVLLMNRKLYSCFLQARGLAFAIACVPLHLCYYVCCGLSFLYVLGKYSLLKEPARKPTRARRLLS